MSLRDGPLAHLRVHDAMHTGILTTDASTPLRVVARLMAEQRVHAVAVTNPDNVGRPWGIVSALDVAAAAAAAVDTTAGEAAGTAVVTVSASDPLEHAARVMVERQVSHLIVVDPASGHPAGILSTLDVVAAYAG
ncbi:MAG: cyclic nucleotide-binding/CBS domain-containing protein [Solirubrobacteraceae bacterium]